MHPDTGLVPILLAFLDEYRPVGLRRTQRRGGSYVLCAAGSTVSQPLLIYVERIIAWTRTAARITYRVVP